MVRLFFVVTLLLSSCFAQQSYTDLLQHWDYDKSASLDLKETGVQNRNGIAVHDISYATSVGDRGARLGPNAGRVTAYLVVPPGKGPHPAVIYGHWCMPGSAKMNRTEFLDEALLLAKSGVISLLPNHVITNPGFVQDNSELNQQQIDVLVQQVTNMRRGADLLLARKDVAPNRIAFVGHSCNGQVAALLSGIDERFKAIVVMASGLSDEVDVKTEQYQDYRKKVGGQKFDAFLATYNWTDPGKYISHSNHVDKLLQFASDEPFLKPGLVQKYMPFVADPKVWHIYNAPHALNAKATQDRINFLSSELKFPKPSPKLVAALPALEQPEWPKPQSEGKKDNNEGH